MRLFSLFLAKRTRRPHAPLERGVCMMTRKSGLRSARVTIRSMDNAYYKAYTIASLGLSRKEETTKQIADRMAKNPPTNVPQTQLPNVTYAQGAIAIMAGGNTIGGLGVSGAPGGQFDEECARAALAKIKDRMK